MASILKDISKENFEDYNISIERCINNLQSIFITLDSYKVIRNDPQMQAIQLIEAQLRGIANSIELEKSYKLFCELVGVEYVENGKKIVRVPVLLLAEAIKEHNVPFLPWQSIEDNGFQIYTDINEQYYYQDLESSKARILDKPEENISFKFTFDKNTLSVLQEMKKHIRSREIFHLYRYITLMEDLKSNYHAELVGIGGAHDNFSKSLSLEKDEKVITEACKNKVKTLFKKHFDQTEKVLKERGVINSDRNKIDEQQWLNLQNKLAIFGNKLIQIERQFKPTLVEIDNHIKNKNNAEKDKDKLYKEVNDFLKKNSLITYDNEEIQKFPTARQISNTKPGGPGILKKITDSGGLPQFESQLQLYARRTKRTIPDVPPLFLEASSEEGALVKGPFKKNEESLSPPESH